jgi:hypothetical protein
MAQDLKYGSIDIPGIPEDEPVFVLRAQDKAAMGTLFAYSQVCAAAGAGPDHQAGIRAAHQVFLDWAVATGGTKVPDTGVLDRPPAAPSDADLDDGWQG